MALDPLGLVVRDLRAAPPVAAIVATRVAGGGFDPNWPEDPRPCIVVEGGGNGRTPWGAGSEGVGLQEQVAIVRCYGAAGDDDVNDQRPAKVSSGQLRGAVMDALHNKGYRGFGNGRFIFQSHVLSSAPAEDPDTHWPYETVMVRVIAPAQAVA